MHREDNRQHPVSRKVILNGATRNAHPEAFLIEVDLPEELLHDTHGELGERFDGDSRLDRASEGWTAIELFDSEFKTHVL